MATPRNYYEILQVSPYATLAEIKIAFRRLARQYHPDLHPNQPNKSEIFKEICQAYEILSDLKLREKYDLEINLQETQSTSEVTRNFPQSDWYDRGLRKSKEKNYQGAIEDYNQAISNQQNFWQAYLKRAEAYYQLAQDSLVLEDCQTVLKINPSSEQSYYYLGLSRQRLGYTQSAIDAYTKAIQLDDKSPQFYYHRGLAYEELQNYTQSINDFIIALQLFQKKRDVRQVSLIKNRISHLSKKKSNNREEWLKSIFDHTFGIFFKLILSFWLVLKHPQEGLLLAFMSLSKVQALIIGVIYSLMASLIGNASIVFPFALITLSSGFGRRLTKSYGYVAGDIFLGGFISLLLSLIFYLNDSRTNLPETIILVGTISLLFYLAHSLNNGYTQISNIPTKPALFLTMAMLCAIVYGLISWS